MAVRVPSLAPSGAYALTVTWSGLLAGDSGDKWEDAAWLDRSVQIEGNFGTGATLSFQGSNDGVNWQLVTDPQGNDVVRTGPDLEQITEVTRYLRPLVTGGDGATNITVTLYVRRNK